MLVKKNPLSFILELNNIKIKIHTMQCYLTIHYSRDSLYWIFHDRYSKSKAISMYENAKQKK